MNKQPKYLKLPLSPLQVKDLFVGDIVYLTGIICTGRDQVHKRIVDLLETGKKIPEEFLLVQGGAIYHMGPIVKKIDDSNYKIISGGPTTSDRMNPYQTKVCKALQIPIIIGKGGMRGVDWGSIPAVYLQYPGGAGAIASRFIEKVEKVLWLDLGLPEAAWFLKVKDFGPLVVAIDSHQGNIFLK